MNTPIFYFLMGIVFVWVLSYFYNYQASRSKLTRIARWLKDSLPILGGNPTSRWQGSNTLHILLNDGRGVISDGAIVVGTQSKELFAALVSLVRGGRDSLNFIFTLRPTPLAANAFEIFEAVGQIPRVVVLSNPDEWQVELALNGLYRVAYRTIAGRDIALRLITLLNDYGLDIRRISLRTEVPHLLLSFNLRTRINVDSHELLGTIRNLAEESVRGTTVSNKSNKNNSKDQNNKPGGSSDSNAKKPAKTKHSQPQPPSPLLVNDPLTPRFGPPLSPYYEPGITKNYDRNADKN